MLIVIETAQKASENGFDTKELLQLIGFVVTIALGVINVISSTRINKKSRYVNAVTTERVKWMAELKELLSKFISLTKYYDRKAILDEKDSQDYFEKLYYLQSKIKLHLNYLDERDEKINSLVEEIINKYHGLYEMKEFLKKPEDERYKEILTERKYDKLSKRVFSKYNITHVHVQKMLKENDTQEMMRILNLVYEELREELKNKYGYKGQQELINKTIELVEISRQYMKEEWEKVKDESK